VQCRSRPDDLDEVGRRRRGARFVGLVVVVVVVACSAVASACSPSSADVRSPAVESAPSAPVAEGRVTDAVGWRSTRVIDGDTFDVSGPDGKITVRLVGINAPESEECFGEEATDALADLVEGEALVLVADRSDADRFGRALRYVETADGVDVGAELVAEGFAIARRYPPDDARADVYARLQRAAQDDRRGLWAPDACGTSDVAGVEIGVEVNADAPGDDGRNLNGEWVRFTNDGADVVDLDGWEVADESASNRYRFSDLRLDPGRTVTLFSGCGADDDTNRFWCASASAVWNNSGDTVFLRDGRGNIVVSFSYGDSG
jgi:endonuclease YncB( thermonuclease family)